MDIAEIGDLIPGNVLVTDLNTLTTVYMNQSGCNILGHSVEEIAELGPEYFAKFFIPEEIERIMFNYMALKSAQNPANSYTFVHRVKAKSSDFYTWYLATASLLYEPGKPQADKVLLVVNNVNSSGTVARKIEHVLDDCDFTKGNFEKFRLLTNQEKLIITLLMKGETSNQIADYLNISPLTVNTHRRNIHSKLQIKSFAELYIYALRYGLI